MSLFLPPHPILSSCIFRPYADKLGRICLDILKGASHISVPQHHVATRTARPHLHVVTYHIRFAFWFYVWRELTPSVPDKWSPALQIRTVLLSIQALLSAPNPDDPLATDVAKHYKENEKDAQRVSREWTEKYAHA